MSSSHLCFDLQVAKTVASKKGGAVLMAEVFEYVFLCF